MTFVKSIAYVALGTGLFLLIPLVAMLFTAEVNWTLSDFVAAGLLLFGAGLAYVLVARLRSNGAYRLATAIAVVAGLLLVWINLAVGFIGSEDNPANLLYGAVLVVALVGAVAARFRPLGLARAMLAAAFTQLLVPLVAAAIWHPAIDAGLLQVLALNTLFAGIWAVAGWLFRHAATGAAGLHQQLA